MFVIGFLLYSFYRGQPRIYFFHAPLYIGSSDNSQIEVLVDQVEGNTFSNQFSQI